MRTGGGVFVAEPVTGGILGRHLAGLQANGVTTHYQLQPLCEGEATHWDELIAPYESRELFHRKAWLDYLAASQGVDIRMWSIQNDRETLGYFCGGIVRKGRFRILGSPLKGWGTNFMGPVVNANFDQRAFLEALDELARRDGFAIVELEHRGWPPELFHNAGYEPLDYWTYELRLSHEDEMLGRMDKSRRYGIRKAIRAGLKVEEANDPGIADEFYDLYSQIMRRKGLATLYPREVPQLLFSYLKPVDLLLALCVRNPVGKLLATGLFPHDQRTMYFWGGAGDKEAEKQCPNDLMHWTAIRWAAERGMTHYNMSGWGQFKREFGGELQPLTRWHKCFSRSARWARRGYEMYFQKEIRVRGWLQQVTRGLRGI
jgi:CelD/BcsL family acetyltransferase involved in cellulose biosynthesis